MLKRFAIIIALIALTIGYSLYQKSTLEKQLVPAEQAASVLQKLPLAQFETLEGQPFDLQAAYPLDLLIVHYWGTWCAPCEAELPDLLSFIKRFEGQPGVKFLLVAVDDEVVKVKKHIASLGIPKANISWLIDNKKVHRDIFGTTRVPETYVFSSDKTNLRKYVGPQEWNKPLFFQTFDEFMQISTRKL